MALRLPSRRVRVIATTSIVLAVLVTARVATVGHANQPGATPIAVGALATPIAASAQGGAQPSVGMRTLSDRVNLTFRAPVQPPTFPPITESAGILIDTDTGTILWQQKEHQALAPASTTKILTALVALENFPDTRSITVTPAALTQAWDETKMGLTAGQSLTVRELLTGMMMVSANDAATVLATDTVGMPTFVRTMNQQVAELGLHDSHFVQPVGLDDPGQKASAYDLAVMGIEAYDNFSLFRSIVGTESTVLPADATHPTYYLSNINTLLTTYPGVQGIKPGYTGDAGYCLVGMATRNGHRLVSVLLNAPYVYHESALLMDWGFRSLGVPNAIPTPSTPSPSPRPSA